MNIFKGASQTSDSIQDINTKTLSKIVTIVNNECTISIEDAQFGKIDGKEIILDKTLVDNTFKEIAQSIAKNHSKYNPIPKKIVISHSDIEKDSPITQGKEDFLNVYEPRWNLENVYISEQSKKQIITALTIVKHKNKLFNEWGLKDTLNGGRGIVLNFWGPPGTGKSMSAEAIAHYLNKKVYSVNYAELESKYVGDTPKNIKKSFQRASENNAVLIFDEADSFLGKRLTNVSQSADYGVNITRSVMLLELEKFDGVVIFTTNLINNYDDAFKRRILANIEFKNPDQSGREAIWKVHLPTKLPLEGTVTCQQLAMKYEKTSGADIKDMLLYAATACLQREGEQLQLSDFDEAHQFVMSRYHSDVNVKVKTEVITNEQYEEEVRAFDKGSH